jgi:hypothetical protein
MRSSVITERSAHTCGIRHSFPRSRCRSVTRPSGARLLEAEISSGSRSHPIHSAASGIVVMSASCPPALAREASSSRP